MMITQSKASCCYLLLKKVEPLGVCWLSINTTISNQLGEEEAFDGVVSAVLANQISEWIGRGMPFSKSGDDVCETG